MRKAIGTHGRWVLMWGRKALHGGIGADFAGNWHVWDRNLFRRDWVRPRERAGKTGTAE